MDSVVIKKCAEYKVDYIKKAIMEGLDMIGGIETFIKPGEKVLLKPNTLTGVSPDAAVTTHPEFLRAMIRIVKAKTQEVYVGDSPGGPFGFAPAAKKAGMFKVIEDEGAKLMEFKEDVQVSGKNSLAYKNFKISAEIQKMDKIINLPKIKTHQLMHMTLCVKNMFGLIPGMRKVEYHLKAGSDKELFAKMLVDFYNIVTPALNIVDGIVGLEGKGPGADGEPIKLGVILMGTGGFSLDHAIAKLCGVEPDRVYTNAVYKKYILKGAEPEYIIKGEQIKDVHKKIKTPPYDMRSNVPGPVYRLVKDLATPKPVFVREKCTGCLICVQNCPVTALKYEGKQKGVICDYKKCIRCYVCHELCTYKAIKISRGLFKK